MKKNFFFSALIIMFLFSIPEILHAGGGTEGMCPLPATFKVKGDCVKDNANPGCRMGESLQKDKLDGEVKEGDESYSFYVEENKSCEWSFVAKPKSGGQEATPKQIEDGQSDTTTGQEYIDWMPNLDTYHPLNLDKSPVLQTTMTTKSSCYKHKGINKSGVKWNSQDGWKVNNGKVSFVYHMDSPGLYGNCGHIGYQVSPGESAGDGGASFDEAKDKFNFTYKVPSVPIWYTVSAGMTIAWDWPYQYSHCWEITHGSWIYVKGKKVLCGKCMQPADPCEMENSMSPYWTPDKSPQGDTTNWTPDKIFTDIQKPSVAKDRMGEPLYYDESGIPGTVYSVPSASFDRSGKPAVVARAKVYVKDLYNVAHAEVGIPGEGNEITGRCGEKISQFDDKEMVIRIVDNAPHATKLTVVDNGEKKSDKGEWDENNFKVYFWYEMPLYQYASYLGERWKDPAGVEKLFVEKVYSPMFVWKKHTICEKLSDFFKGGNDTSYVYWYNNDKHVEYDGSGNGEDKGNPMYVIYEKKLKVSELFVSDDDGLKEDILPWHYAETSKGDPFGNPPYKADDKNDLYGYCKDADGNSVIANFKKYKPMDFTAGKGPLKYFVEVHDGSKLTNGGGLKGSVSDAAKSYNCSNQYMKPDKYEHGQLQFNPEKVKYLQYPKDTNDMSPGAKVDPTVDPNLACQVEDYQDYSNDWTKDSNFTDDGKRLSKNVGGADEVVKNFQPFGRVKIIDKIKPNVGLKIVDTVRGSIRKVYKINDLSTLKCMSDLKDAGKEWALVDHEKFNHFLVDTKKNPRAPFSLNKEPDDDLWEFKDVNLLTSTSPQGGKIWEGKDFEGTEDDMKDSMAPYGTAEDTKLNLTHQDLRDDKTKSNFVTFFCHDNIDGQRVLKDTNKFVKTDWYKGVTSCDLGGNTPKDPEFPDDLINKGYSSWLIKDDTIIDQQLFEQLYKNNEFYKYPDISFNNPNRKWDGNPLPNGEKEISVAYAVIDAAGNFRRFKLYLYTAPLDVKIITIEKKEKRTE